MTIQFSVNGALATVPGTYDYFRVQDSLPAPTPGAQNIFIFGEAEQGVPSSFLDPTLNFFTDYNSVLRYYGSGNIVDACRQIFTNQPSAAFNGSVGRVYIYKTNATTRAERQITSPANYGFLASSVWSEAGNLIKTQIIQSQAEVLPSATFQFIPSSVAYKLEAVISGVKYTTATIPGLSLPSLAASDLAAAVGASATVTGGSLRSLFLDSLSDIAVSALNDVITISLTLNGGTSSFSAVQIDDVLIIPQASGVVGAGAANAGSYVVTASSAVSITAQKVHSLTSAGVDHVYTVPVTASALAVDSTKQAAYATAEFMVFSPITITVATATVSGSAATLELLESADANVGARLMLGFSNFVSIMSASSAAIASVSAVASGSALTVTLSGGTFSSIPSVGDMAFIQDGTLLHGSNANVGLFLVTAAAPTSLSLLAIQPATLVSVPSVAIAGANDFILAAPAMVSTSVADVAISSGAEAKVAVVASRVTDNAVWPTTSIGGNVVLEIGYWDATSTAASLSINAKSQMIVSFTGGTATTVTIPMLKFITMGSLVTYINSLPGFKAALINKKDSSLPVTVMDMVTGLGILSGSSLTSLNGRIKKDFYDWNQSFLSNAGGLLAFGIGTATLQCGLPAVDALPSFLSGADLGGTSGASVSAALDAAIKCPTSQVIPLFSRDAAYDIEDGLTDGSSSYQIAAIHSLVEDHVASASSDLVRKERFGLISIHSSFDDAKTQAQQFAYERLQMSFQMPRSVSSDGTVQFYEPWMLSCVTAAGRVQSTLGTSMLRKNFNVSQVKHIGNLPPYSDTLVVDFTADDNGQLTEAIEAGLLTFGTGLNGGVQVLSPDLSTRSRNNDPQGWVWERLNVLFCCDQVRATLRSNLDNFIGSRTSDITPYQVQKVATDTLSSFTRQGILLAAAVVSCKSLGNQYTMEVTITPPEALEAIVISVTAQRSVSAQ